MHKYLTSFSSFFWRPVSFCELANPCPFVKEDDMIRAASCSVPVGFDIFTAIFTTLSLFGEVTNPSGGLRRSSNSL